MFDFLTESSDLNKQNGIKSIMTRMGQAVETMEISKAISGFTSSIDCVAVYFF